MSKLSEQEYDTKLSRQLSQMFKEYGELRVEYSWERTTEEQFSKACRELLSKNYKMYQDTVFENED